MQKKYLLKSVGSPIKLLFELSTICVIPEYKLFEVHSLCFIGRFYAPGFHSTSRQVEPRLFFPYVRWILRKTQMYELYERGGPYEMDSYYPTKGF